MTASTTEETSLARYSRCAQSSAARVIGHYSTSFGVATRLLDARVRVHIRNIYGLVRIADELVDGAAAAAGLSVDDQRAILDALEEDVDRAVATAYSTNLVVHAFAETARAAGIGSELTGPFFASMRRDLDPAPFTTRNIEDYIYGSAEVVGLMCLRVFLLDQPVTEEQRERLEAGARRLGAAFQKINFLRDLSEDWRQLGRNYFPGITPERLTDAQRDELVTDIEVDLLAAHSVIDELPRGSRAAVLAAHDLFRALCVRARAVPAAQLLTTRVRVSGARKAIIVLRAQLTGLRRTLK